MGETHELNDSRSVISSDIKENYQQKETYPSRICAIHRRNNIPFVPFLPFHRRNNLEGERYLSISAFLTVHEYRLLTAGPCSHVCGFQTESQL